MCPVQWMPPAPGLLSMPFLSCPPDQHISIVDPPSRHACIALHFPEGVRGSVPCMGKGECPHCSLPTKVHAYTVAAVYAAGCRDWRAMIVDLGFQGSDLATTDYTGMQLRVGRKKSGDNRSDLVVKEAKVLPDQSSVHKFPSMDVRPLLMRRWGLYAEASHLEREAYYEQQRLGFTGTNNGT